MVITSTAILVTKIAAQAANLLFSGFLPSQVAFIGLADKRLHEIPVYLKNPIFVTVGQPFSLFHISHTVLHKVPFFFLSTNINFYAKWLL